MNYGVLQSKIGLKLSFLKFRKLKFEVKTRRSHIPLDLSSNYLNFSNLQKENNFHDMFGFIISEFLIFWHKFLFIAV